MEPAPVAGQSIGKNPGPTFVLHRIRIIFATQFEANVALEMFGRLNENFRVTVF